MLAEEDVSQLVQIAAATTCFAERWLPSGKLFEFTTRPTQDPPLKLIEEFQALVGNIGVLGLYYRGLEEAHDGVDARLEWTEGRKNMVKRLIQEDWKKGSVETAWSLSTGDPVTMRCVLFCVTATTDQGGGHLSKL
ncbi:hypothetical protein ACMFMG_011798 [Clarireedia jacksonii]